MSDVDPGERAWYAKPSFIAAAAVLALVVVGGGVAIGVNQFGGEDAPPAASSNPVPTSNGPTAPSETASTDASSCGIPGVEDASTLDAAPSAEWSAVGTLDAPATDAGPGVVDTDGFRSCYAHTAEGALLAVANYMALTTEPALADRLPELFTDTDELPAGTADGYANVRASIAGYRVLAYSADEATIELALRVSSADDQLVVLPFSMWWVDGDWRFSLDSAAGAPTVVSSLGGYTTWGPDGS